MKQYNSKGDLVVRFNRSRQAGLVIIAVVAFVNFATGIYHLTHEGWRSGITELVLTSLLLIAGYLLRGASQ